MSTPSELSLCSAAFKFHEVTRTHRKMVAEMPAQLNELLFEIIVNSYESQGRLIPPPLVPIEARSGTVDTLTVRRALIRDGAGSVGELRIESSTSDLPAKKHRIIWTTDVGQTGCYILSDAESTEITSWAQAVVVIER